MKLNKDFITVPKMGRVNEKAIKTLAKFLLLWLSIR